MDTSLAVALVGVGGTLAGVALSQVGHALVESRRRDHEQEARFHAERRAVYARFLGHLNVRRKYASDLNIYWDTPEFDRVRQEAPDEGEWLREAQEIMAEIHLLGDAQVIDAATSLVMVSLAGPLVMFAPSATRPTREQVRERAAKGEKLFRDAYGPCLRAMRASLGAPEPGDFHVV